MNQCDLRSPTPGDWPQIGELLANSFPNALASQFGRRFCTLYYRHLGEGPGACVLAAFNESGKLAGVAIATLDRLRARRLPFGFMLRLLAAAHFRLLSPAFLLWLARSGCTETKPEADATAPRARLLAIAVAPEFRGQQLSSRFLDGIEDFFRKNGLRQPYIILTEKTNNAANSLYQKFGARFAGTNLYHGKQINEWHKTIA